MATKVDWAKAIKPLIKKYSKEKHPLNYHNMYELIVMVILSARSSDKAVNEMAPLLFEAYPNMAAMSKASVSDLVPLVKKIPGHLKKADWIIRIAQTLKSNDAIPLSMEELVKLPGIGRKSANVIMREGGAKAEGVMVDLHVVRVAPRLGIAKGEDPTDIEQQIMKKTEPKDWGEVGMAISFLGREICRPTDPMHDKCIMKEVCQYHLKRMKK